jgi:hypothetical protein
MDYQKEENMMTLTCSSEDDGLGASAERTTVGGFSFCFLNVLFGDGGTIVTSSEEIGTSSLVDTIFSKLIFAFFEGGGFISPSELHKQI